MTRRESKEAGRLKQNQAIYLRKEGLSIPKIAQRIGRSKSRVHQYLNRHEWELLRGKELRRGRELREEYQRHLVVENLRMITLGIRNLQNENIDRSSN